MPVATLSSRKAMFLAAGLTLVAVESVGCALMYGAPADFQDIPPSPTADASRPPAVVTEPLPPRSCYAPSSFVAGAASTPSLGRAVCSADDIRAVRESCLGKVPAACEATIAANPECTRCAMGRLPDDTMVAPLGARVPLAGAAYVPAIEACGALVIGKPQCAVELSDEAACIASACGSCNLGVQYTQCVNEARAGVCVGVATKACRDAIASSRATWQSRCVGDTPEATFSKIATLFCGPPTGDAGAGDGGAADAEIVDGSSADAGTDGRAPL